MGTPAALASFGPGCNGAAALTAGISASLTGQFATQGRQALAGLGAWVEYVNGSGGMLVDGRRHRVTLRHLDDGSRADGAWRNTERLLGGGGVDLLFGPYSAGLTTAVAEVAAAHGRVVWNHGGAGDAVYGRSGGGYVVGILTPANRYLVGLPALARSVCPDARTLAIAWVDAGAFARQVSDGAEAAARALGFDTILRLSYPPDTADLGGIAGQIADAAPDVLVAVGRIRHDIGLARALRAQGRRPAIGLAAVVATPIADFGEALGADADGFVGPSQWEPQVAVAAPDFGPTAGAAMWLMRRAASVHSVAVDYPMAQAFAGGLVAQRCLAEAGGTDDAGLYAAALSADFTTFYGRFRIDGDGRQVGRSVALVQRQGERKAVVWPPEQADGRARWGF